MKYSEINANFNKPVIWKRPEKDKLPKIGKTYIEFSEEIEEFKTIQEQCKKEITEVFTRNIDAARTRNELNRNVSEIATFYEKAVLPTDELDADFLLAKTNKNTLAKKLQPWCTNLADNIETVIGSKPFNNLIGRFRDIPAFVVMAGPSLRNNRDKLKRAKGKGLIIAVDTSLRPLLDAGIVPDICVTHDANPNGCKFFLSGEHELNKANAQLNDLKPEQLNLVKMALEADKERLNYKYDTVGCFINYCHPLTLLAWNGSAKCFYQVWDPGLPVYRVMGGATGYRKDADGKYIPEHKGSVVGGSSVGHVAVYIASQLGCNPISLIGCDLSYPGGMTYVDGASNQKSMKNQKLIDMEDLSGNKVPTNLSMLSYKMVFERSLPQIIVQLNIEIFNCTEDARGNPAGILEIGAEPRSLDWVIDKYCKKELNLNVKEVLEKGGEN